MTTRLTRAALLLAGLIAAAASDAATLTVTSGADSGAGSLRQAIADAANGDTVVFSAGLSTVSITTAQLLVSKNLTISGPGPALLTIRRDAPPDGAQFRIFQFYLATATLSGVTVTNGVGTSIFGGGGIENSDGTLTIINSKITGNTAIGTSPGGGISNVQAGVLNLINSTVSNNAAGTGPGGGIANSCDVCTSAASTMTITNSTISGNSAASAGGILNGVNGQLTIEGSTISGNQATAGGGIYSQHPMTITNSTVTDNHAVNFGGGIFATPVAFVTRNSIFALNTAPSSPDVGGGITTQGYNIVGVNSQSNIPTTGDQYGVSAVQLNLGPLQDNGGPTFTHALLPGSVAVEAGNSGSATTDQRGFARPVDSPAVANAAGSNGGDIGAYEMQGDLLPGCSNINRVVQNGNDSGTDSLRDVISNVCAGSTITFAPGVTAVTLASAQLSITKSLTIRGPGANLLSIQRIASLGTPFFRIFDIAVNAGVTLAGLSVENGTLVGPNGGGISNAGTLTLDRVSVSGNTAAGGNGGGIQNQATGTLTILGSTISYNSINSAAVIGSGGGIYNGGVLKVVNSTVSGNTAGGPGGTSDSGGGIFSNSGTVMLISSTITGNSGDLGGGVRGANGAVITARNTIIALNASGSGPDVNGPLISEGFNLIGIPTSPAAITPLQFTDQLGVSAQQLNLGFLAFNAGPTRTHALGAGSFARDAGHSSGYGNDQRGVPRPTDLPGVINATGGDGSDIGAFEEGVLSLDIDGNGILDPLTDGVLILRYLSGYTGVALTSGAIGSSPLRYTPAQITAYLDSIKPALDVDGNGKVDALTDGLLLVRYLFGVRGSALTTGALGSSPARTGTQIDNYISSLTP